MCKEILMNVHDMEPPEPLDVAMKGLENLKHGEYIRMIHRMQPHPLYEILLDSGFRYKVTNGEFGFDIYIWFAKDKKTGDFVKTLI